MIICNDVHWFEESVLILNILMENMEQSVLKALLSLKKQVCLFRCVCGSQL